MDHTANDTVTGIYRADRRGYGFVVPDGEEERPDLFIPPRKEGGAWHGDRVTARSVREEDGRLSGRVTAVLERANTLVVGVLRRRGRELWLVPDNDRLPGPILLSGKTKRVRDGDKAACALLSFGGREGVPLGTLREQFGPAGSRESAVAAILFENEIDPAFPPAVLEEAEALPRAIPEEALRGRLDLRGTLTITIDGSSAKDLDDAVSLTTDHRGRPVLGVHIADVGHYVPQGSLIDREAFERGTSVYFADRVVPMLPPALSNGVCSLNPREDRLTLSCLMTLNEDGTVAEHTIAESVIRTAERMNYEDCNVLLQGGDRALEERYAAVLPLLRGLAQVAAIQEKRRRGRGALDLSGGECVISCDQEGHPVGVEFRQQGTAEKLIEQCMLCANETVAEHLFSLRKPAVYRVHEKPAASREEGLRAMLAPLGIALPDMSHGALQAVLRQVKGTPEELAVNTMVLRSLQKARYDERDLGHFGLAAEHYCHFTSPIRRYPDLTVHRLLKALLRGALTGASEKKALAFVRRAALQSSQRELSAQNAEREIEKRYVAEYLSAHLGEVFPGVVSGASRGGLFVLLPGGAEGFLSAEALPDDRYAYEETRLRLVGERTGSVYAVGRALEVVCVRADPSTGQVDLALAGSAPAPKRGGEEQSGRKEASLPGRRGKGGKRPMHVPKKRRR